MPAAPVRVGNVEIVCVTDVTPTLPFEFFFPDVPPADWPEFMDRYPDAFGQDSSGIRVHMGAYWIRCADGPVVVDTGLGPRPVEALGGAKGSLPDDLAAHDLDPDEAAIVFLTHAHIDHVGWNTVDGERLLFSNARHVLHERDWETFHDPAVLEHWPEYVPQTLDPLERAGVLDLIDREHSLTPELTAFPTPGHTPGHMSVLVSSNGEQAILTGDVVINPAQVTHPEWNFGFDSDPAEGVATRTALLDRIESEGLRLISCHFPAPGVGTIIRVEGTRYFQGAAPN